VRTPELGRTLATKLGAADAVFMLSHGIAFVGTTIREATMIAIFLEKAVRAQITIASTGFPYEWPTEQDAKEKRAVTRTARGIDNYFEYLVRRLERSER
jgi:L-fuculose-phosphate aldolase